MKSWLKALFISVVVLAVCTLFLPTLLKQGFNSFLPWAMETANLKNPQVLVRKFNWHNIEIETLQFELPSPHSTLEIKNLHISFSPWKLLSGQLSTLTLDQGAFSIIPNNSNNLPPKTLNSTQSRVANTQDSYSSNTDSDSSASIDLLSLKEIFKEIPIAEINIKSFVINHPQGVITSRFESNREKASLENNISTPLLLKDIQHKLLISDSGEIDSRIHVVNSDAPILNLQAQWKENSDNKGITLSLQQSADIQSWLKLFSKPDKSTSHNAKVAIQAWNLELLLPKQLNPSKLLTSLTAQGLLQVKVTDFYLRKDDKANSLIEDGDMSINIKTSIDPTRDKQWSLLLESFDLNADTHTLAEMPLTIQQSLAKALEFSCSVKQNNTHCSWQGSLLQKIQGHKLKNQLAVEIEGSYQKEAIGINKFVSQQTFNINTLQENDLWPKIKNTSQGDLIISAQQESTSNDKNVIDNKAWHWQLNLPYGINNTSHLLEPLLAEKPDAKLSEIKWQLLPDWQLTGINSELTSAKVFSIFINELNWKNNKQSLLVDYANISCNLDWLKFQYSSQLRSQQALSELPLDCHWDMKNKPSQWDQWPLPAINLSGELLMSSLNLKQAKLNTKMKVSSLANALDLTLLAQHNFKGLQQGSAQLYIDNLELNWEKMGLPEMVNLTKTQLLAGSLSAQGWVQWQQHQADIFDDTNISWRWKPDLMLRVDDLAGVYQETTTWEDIDIQLAIRRPLYEEFRIDSQVSALSINPGINIENVLARSTATIQDDFKQALIVIEEVHSDVLGGRINVPLVRYDTSQSTNAFGIEVEGLQIEQLAALEANSGVEASGLLDGVLPIILLPEGPQVPAGSLFARAPGGVIKFTGQAADSLKQSDPTVSLAMQVLSDFRYDKLQTDVTYQPNGELKLGLQFQGKNPTFFDGQATHLNLNLDYNLLDLLSSLRVSNDIVQKLENKYQ